VERVTTERKNGFASSKAAVILLVEDEERLRHSLRKLLEGVGYVVLAASHGNEALRIFEENHQHIDLVLTDVGLPFFRGPELVERLKTRQPQIKALFMSGFGKDSLRPHETARLAGCFVQKPFRKDVLLRKLEQALDGHRSRD
jgi:two-component system cell cycle sensor histidine kinase/response regulator CckA